MGLAGFEPTNSSAQGWHHTKLDNNPKIYSSVDRTLHNFKFRTIEEIFSRHYNVIMSTPVSFGIIVCSACATILPLPSINIG